MWGNLGAATIAWVIGYLAEQDRWQTVFLISAIAMAINALCWFLFDASRPVVREPK
jgi:hypothetical protein